MNSSAISLLSANVTQTAQNVEVLVLTGVFGIVGCVFGVWVGTKTESLAGIIGMPILFSTLGVLVGYALKAWIGQ